MHARGRRTALCVDAVSTPPASIVLFVSFLPLARTDVLQLILSCDVSALALPETHRACFLSVEACEVPSSSEVAEMARQSVEKQRAKQRATQRRQRRAVRSSRYAVGIIAQALDPVAANRTAPLFHTNGASATRSTHAGYRSVSVSGLLPRVSPPRARDGLGIAAGATGTGVGVSGGGGSGGGGGGAAQHRDREPSPTPPPTVGSMEMEVASVASHSSHSSHRSHNTRARPSRRATKKTVKRPQASPPSARSSSRSASPPPSAASPPQHPIRSSSGVLPPVPFHPTATTTGATGRGGAGGAGGAGGQQAAGPACRSSGTQQRPRRKRKKRNFGAYLRIDAQEANISAKQTQRDVVAAVGKAFMFVGRTEVVTVSGRSHEFSNPVAGDMTVDDDGGSVNAAFSLLPRVECSIDSKYKAPRGAATQGLPFADSPALAGTSAPTSLHSSGRRRMSTTSTAAAVAAAAAGGATSASTTATPPTDTGGAAAGAAFGAAIRRVGSGERLSELGKASSVKSVLRRQSLAPPRAHPPVSPYGAGWTSSFNSHASSTSTPNASASASASASAPVGDGGLGFPPLPSRGRSGDGFPSGTRPPAPSPRGSSAPGGDVNLSEDGAYVTVGGVRARNVILRFNCYAAQDAVAADTLGATSQLQQPKSHPVFQQSLLSGVCVSLSLARYRGGLCARIVLAGRSPLLLSACSMPPLLLYIALPHPN